MSPIPSTSKAIAPPAQPTPSYILRGHTAQISILAFSGDGRTLFSGDVDGYVAVWDLKVFRPRLFWKAHEGGLLAVEEWDEGFLTQGRDNRIHYFPLPPRPSSISRASASAIPSPKDPSVLLPSWSMDVNAMAYCRMSVLSLGDPRTRNEGIVAVPSLTKDEEIDIFHLPSQSRVHRAIGASLFPIGSKTGTLMAATLFLSPSPAADLCILAGYEDGRVALFRFTGPTAAAFEPPRPGAKQDEAEDWGLVWDEKGHREALMSLALAPDKKSAWSVAADHFVCRYDLRELMEQSHQKPPVPPPTRMIVLPTTAPGRSTIAVRDDGKLIGVAGWDGEARLYSAKTGAPLAVLSYHRMSLHALAFAPTKPRQGSVFEEVLDEDDSDEEDGIGKPRAWMATGGKDDRISLWEVYPPP